MLACVASGLRVSPALTARRAIRMMSGPDDDLPAISQVMGTVIEKGFSEGKRVKYGVFTESVDPSSVPAEEEQRKRREDAARDLVNIDMQERQRRTAVGTAGSVLTAALGVGLLAAHAPVATRFAIAFPLFLSYGFLESGRTGL